MYFVFRRPINAATVRRRLRDVGLRCRRPKKGYILTQRHKAGRLAWARVHQRWTRRQWGSVLFSDESKFNVQNCDGRVRVYRPNGERFLDKHVKKCNRGAGGSVHVWAGISQFHRTDLVILNRNVNARAYIDDVLRPVALPFLRRHFGAGGFNFQQDNAPAHTARLTTQFLAANNVPTMNWPSLSPDMSPIEHVWDMLGRRVKARFPQPNNVQELTHALVQEWRQIPQQQIANLVLSMRRRCLACVAADGSYTRY